MSADSPARSRIYILLAALVWSTAGAVIKLGGGLTAMQIVGGRAFFAAIAIYFLLPKSRLGLNANIARTALAYALNCTLFVFANTLTTAGNAIFIQNAAPFWVLLLGPRLLGEKAQKNELWSLPFCFLGIGLFFASDIGHGRIAGDLVAAASSVAFAMLILMYRQVSSAEGLAATVWGNGLLVLFALPSFFLNPAPSGEGLVLFAYLGIVQQALAVVLFIRGVRGVTALESSLLVLLEPLFSPIWAYLAVGERLGPLALLGAAVLLTTTVVRNLAPRFRAPRIGPTPQAGDG